MQGNRKGKRLDEVSERLGTEAYEEQKGKRYPAIRRPLSTPEGSAGPVKDPFTLFAAASKSGAHFLRTSTHHEGGRVPCANACQWLLVSSAVTCMGSRTR